MALYNQINTLLPLQKYAQLRSQLVEILPPIIRRDKDGEVLGAYPDEEAIRKIIYLFAMQIIKIPLILPNGHNDYTDSMFWEEVAAIAQKGYNH